MLVKLFFAREQCKSTEIRKMEKREGQLKDLKEKLETGEITIQ
jgi:hypothetical protein